MSTSEKIAVRLPRRLAQPAQRAVRQGRASSVSANVAAALEEKVKLDELSGLLDEMLAEWRASDRGRTTGNRPRAR